MTYEQIEKSFPEHFERYGVSMDEDEDTFKFESPEPSVILSFLKQSFIKYLQSQQEIVKNFAVGVSVDQRGRKWIDLEDLIKIYQAQIKELQ